MAKATFEFTLPKRVSKETAEKTAKTNDSSKGNFDIAAEDNEEITLTGKFFEATWTRREEGKDDATGQTLYAEATGATGQPLQVPFGMFKTVTKLASGGEQIECKGHFGRRTTQQDILKFCQADTKVIVKRYRFFREGNDYETEITKVV